jgi:hypothetical protein
MPVSLTALDFHQHDDRDWYRTAGLLDAETHEVLRQTPGHVSIVIPSWTGVIGAALASGASRETATATAGAH